MGSCSVFRPLTDCFGVGESAETLGAKAEAGRANKRDGYCRDQLGVTAAKFFSLNRFANFCQHHYVLGVSTMNISLPETLKSFVDEQVSSRGFGTSSEYVRELIRKDQERIQLRGLLLAGANSLPGGIADDGYFAGLSAKISKQSAA